MFGDPTKYNVENTAASFSRLEKDQNVLRQNHLLAGKVSSGVTWSIAKRLVAVENHKFRDARKNLALTRLRRTTANQRQAWTWLVRQRQSWMIRLTAQKKSHNEFDN